MNRKDRRSRLEIYYDILKSIQNENTYGVIKPTRLQYGSNLSYDKLTKFLKELKEKNMIAKNKDISVVDKGREFLQEYCDIRKEVQKLGMRYL